MKISLIIPAYNVEKFIDKCVNSCLSQNLNPMEYEIIIINDASKDATLSIVNKLKTQNSNIIIIDKTVNEGLSMARNTGLQYAHGDYVWFIDGDDWIAENCLKNVVEILCANDLDALYLCAADYVNGNLIPRQNLNKFSGRIFSGIEFYLTGCTQVCVPFTIYKTSYLVTNKLVFIRDIYYEDTEFTPRAYYGIRKMMIISKPLYFIFHNPNSITRSVNYKKSFDCIFVAERLFKFTQIISVKEYKLKNYRLMASCLNQGIRGIVGADILLFRRFKNSLLDKKYLFKELVKISELKMVIEGILFYVLPSISFNVVVLYYMLINKLRK